MEVKNRYFRALTPAPLGRAVESTVVRLERERAVARLLARDWTLWKPEDREVSSRLGWLDAPERATAEIPAYEKFAESLRQEGVERVILLGMGGSSLAAEALSRVIGAAPSFPVLEVLDTTAPEAVLAAGCGLDFRKTFFIVSSKSGTTAESNALLCRFYDLAAGELGPLTAGGRFAAITDPGTPLEGAARSLGFRAVFHGTVDVGGRYSALTAFGLVPAACIGADLEELARAAAEAAAAGRAERVGANPGAMLGAVLGAAAESGIDKLTFISRGRLKPFFDWTEQLLAESTGKEGKGIVPVFETRVDELSAYGRDRIFVLLQGPGDPSVVEDAGRLVASGFPVIVFPLDGIRGLGGGFFVWEEATALAGAVMGVNPFDQPDVEATKRQTRRLLSRGPGPSIPAEAETRLVEENIKVFGSGPAESLAGAFETFFRKKGPDDYLAIQAFLPPSADMTEAVDRLAAVLRRRSGLPVTVGFGPRYLHSTGQLHKGKRSGLFLQLTASRHAELAVPEVPGVGRPARSFRELFAAQSWGDWLALKEKGRPVMRLELPTPDAALLDRLPLRA